MVYGRVLVSNPSSLPSGRGYPVTLPYPPSPGPKTLSAAWGWSVLLRLFGRLGALFVSIVFSMPFWVDLGSIFPPNLLPQIYRNQGKSTPRCPPMLTSLFDGFFIDFIPHLDPPNLQNRCFSLGLKKNISIFKNLLFTNHIDFSSMLVATCFHIPSQNPLKSL